MRLRDRPYLAGDEFTSADIISYPWIVDWQGQDIDEFKHFRRWFEEVEARPGVQRRLAVGADLSIDQSKPPPGAGAHPQDPLQPARFPGPGLTKSEAVSSRESRLPG
jgi:hypothetical protein